MKRFAIVAMVLILAVVSLANCGALGSRVQPTITAIPLPSEVSAGATGTPERGPRTGAGAAETPLPTATFVPVAPASLTPVPTLTLIPYGPTPTPLPPLPTLVPPTLVPPTPTATPLAAAAKPVAAKATARPAATPTPQWTGKLVFQTVLGGELYVINADGTGLRRLTDGMDPIWSPDGQRIAFARWRDPRGIWVVNADGSGEQLLFPWSEARWPSWSPDGGQILFTRAHGGRMEAKTRCFRGFCFTLPAMPHWRLGIVTVADQAFREPPSPQISMAPDWSRQGDLVVFSDGKGLAIQSLDGKVSYQLDGDTHDTDGVWSPDGQRIAFTYRQDNHWEVYTVDASGGHLTRLTNTPTRPDGTAGNSAAAAWSPASPGGGTAGRYIAFYTDRAGKWEIWIMKADGSNQQPMFRSALNKLTLDYAFQGDRALSWTD
jgi:dipeptidyl aminopeptidase/acylaminoacyl peptidase